MSVHATRYALALPAWPTALQLRIVVLSDFHICDPFMDARRLRAICAQANALQPDLIVLLGDYLAGPRFSRPPAPDAWATPLAALSAPLGVHAVLGNHDYTGQEHRLARQQPIAIQHALETAGIPVYVNTSVRLEHHGRGFWLAGLGSQFAFVRRGQKWPAGHGMADLDATMNQITTDEPVLLLAHEPDIFPEIPDRVALTLSGHTHGGQVRLFGHAPMVPSRFGQRYLRGHIVEDGRHLIVSAGLGFSGLPIRLGAPAELLVIELGNAT